MRDDRLHPLEVPREQRAQPLGIERLAERGRAGEVAEQHGDGLALLVRKLARRFGAALGAEPERSFRLEAATRTCGHAASLGVSEEHDDVVHPLPRRRHDLAGAGGRRQVAGPVDSIGQRVPQPIISQHVGNVRFEPKCRAIRGIGSTSSSGAVRPLRDEPGPRRTSFSRAHTSGSRSTRRDLELLATAVYMLGRDDDCVAWLEQAHQRHLEDGETLRAVRSAAWIGLNLAARGRRRAGERLARPRPATGRGGGRVRRAGMARSCPRVPARGRRRLRRGGRGRGGGRAHRRALRRPRSLRARDPQPGSLTHQERPGARRARAARRGHGRGDRGGALTRSSRGSSTAASSSRARRCTRCGGRANGPGRSRTGGRSSRRWSRSRAAASSTGPKSCSWTARGAARSRRRTAPESASSRRGIPPPGSPATARESSSGCRATSPARRRRTGRRARSGGSRSRVSPSCASRRVAPMRPSRPSAAQNRRRRAARACAAASRLRRDHAHGGGRRVRTSCLPRARGARDRLRERDARCDGRACAAAPCISPRAEPREALVSLRKRGRDRGTHSTPRTRSRAHACSSESACRALGDEEAAVLEHDAAKSIFERLGAKPDLARFEAPTTAATGSRTSRAGGPASRRRRQDESRDRRIARHQRAHRGTARPEHLREARPLVPRRSDGVRLRARPRLTRRGVVRNDHAGPSRDWWIRAMCIAIATGLPSSETTKEAEMAAESLRHGDRRRRPGGARDGTPPEDSEAGRS